MENSRSGHRQRLRQRFLTSGADDFSEVELLELLLTFAIPRRDVGPLASQLLRRFGSLPNVLTASHSEQTAMPGIGDQAAVLINIVKQLAGSAPQHIEEVPDTAQQPTLFEVEPDLGPLFEHIPEPEEQKMRTFTNDLSAAALEYLPQIVRFKDMEGFQAFLQQSLPYNSFNSRKRYARNLISRYFPSGVVQTPLSTFLTYQPTLDSLKAALFYETARAEPTIRFVAEDVIWPAAPTGHITRAQLRQRLEATFLQASVATIKRMLYSLFNVYTILNFAKSEDDFLRFQIHTGTFEGFLYVLTAEFPQPGMYRFEELEQGPMRHWLLWDREWMHQQLYNLRDFGILSKVSQIDTLRQFTLQYDQWTALRHYFEHPQRNSLALREQSAAVSKE